MDFDAHARSYERDIEDAVGFAGQPPDFYTRVKAVRLIEILRSHFGDLKDRLILDLGCGIGLTDQLLYPRIPKLVGVDVSEESVSEARARNPGVKYLHYSGERLPFEENAIDAVFAICVWHHVPSANWRSFASEIFRVIKPGGLVAIFEHNPWNPLTRHVVSNCVFDQDAELLTSGVTATLLTEAGFVRCRTEYLLFVPIAIAALRSLERRLISWLPLGAQYVVTATKS